jgi:hypothetical protein
MSVSGTCATFWVFSASRWSSVSLEPDTRAGRVGVHILRVGRYCTVAPAIHPRMHSGHQAIGAAILRSLSEASARAGGVAAGRSRERGQIWWERLREGSLRYTERGTGLATAQRKLCVQGDPEIFTRILYCTHLFSEGSVYSANQSSIKPPSPCHLPNVCISRDCCTCSFASLGGGFSRGAPFNGAIPAPLMHRDDKGGHLHARLLWAGADSCSRHPLLGTSLPLWSHQESTLEHVSPRVP